MTSQERVHAEELFFEGNRLLAGGDAPSAEMCFREAVRIAPDFAEAYANLALMLNQRGAADRAEFYYQRSIALDPEHAQTHVNLGALLAQRKRFAEAEAAYIQAISIEPDAPATWSNLGVLYACVKREEDAERCYRTAMALDEGYRAARFNLSYLLLRQERFEEGWHFLEARNSYAALAARLDCPRWQGEALAGKSLLIGHEAGHGDMIQFCRYATMLKAQGASSITMICHPALKRLFATLDGVDTLYSLDQPFPTRGWDFWTPVLSIPYHCKTRSDSIPADLPYLHAAAELIARWTADIPAGGLRVGLAWKGSTEFENDADRSLPGLDVLAPLSTVAGVHLLGLQKDWNKDETSRPPAGFSLLHLGDGITDFADTAAIVAQLDLVICVDTALAHLAGALGKPCWVLLPDYKTDWRWLTGRSDSPWYPSIMRLFRQPKMSNWEAVITEVRAALEQLAHHKERAESQRPAGQPNRIT